MISVRLVLAALTTAVLGACTLAPEQSATPTKRYGVFLEDGQKIGASSFVVEPWQGGQRTIEIFEALSKDTDKHTIRIVDRVTRYMDADGRTTRIERVTGSGRDDVRLNIDIHDGVATAVRKTSVDQTVQKIDVPPTTRFDGGESLLAGWDFASGSELTFDSFNAAVLVVERVVMRPMSAELASDGRRILRSAYRGGVLSSVSELTLNTNGEVVQTDLDLFGAHIVMRAVSEAEAARPSSAANLVTSVMVKSPNRISSEARQGHIRYVFGFGDGRAFDLPQTHEQKAALTGDEVIVDICAICGPGLSVDPAFLAAGLKPTMWLQSGSARLRELATIGPNEATNDRDKMDLLGRRVRRTMTDLNFVGHYSALEAAERHSGDCGEDAVLLTALARAAGIPAYVATGLVYSRERYHGVSNVFVPHNWTMAYVDGEWASFDASLGDFDATHIALSINEGDAGALASAQQLASHLEWRRLMEVRSNPAEASPLTP